MGYMLTYTQTGHHAASFPGHTIWEALPAQQVQDGLLSESGLTSRVTDRRPGLVLEKA